MAITEQLNKLGQSARQLNDSSDELNSLVAAIDRALGELRLEMEFLHPRPLHESASVGREGKRVIELAYLGYLKIRGEHHLAIKTMKVLESKVVSGDGGAVTPLMVAPRPLRHAAVDVLPELVATISRQIDEMAAAIERRCATARALLGDLEAMSARSSGARAMLAEEDESP
ncbi:MAG: hypothetical protein IPK80_31210 [Nannocystis sp.]|nr:hypothetical protein [Nannocystis sp.]